MTYLYTHVQGHCFDWNVTFINNSKVTKYNLEQLLVALGIHRGIHAPFRRSQFRFAINV